MDSRQKSSCHRRMACRSYAPSTLTTCLWLNATGSAQPSALSRNRDGPRYAVRCWSHAALKRGRACRWHYSRPGARVRRAALADRVLALSAVKARRPAMRPTARVEWRASAAAVRVFTPRPMTKQLNVDFFEAAQQARRGLAQSETLRSPSHTASRCASLPTKIGVGEKKMLKMRDDPV